MTVYLDHAATTPMDPQAIAVMAEQLARTGNPSSLHASGRAARRVVEESRESIAAHFGARPSDVIFTSGGTEANNLALQGLAIDELAACPESEHHAVLDVIKARNGVFLPVDETGRFIVESLAEHEIGLLSLMWANNEVGTIQPIEEAVAVAKERGFLIHSDAVQAAAHADLNFTDSGLDAMTISAHKLGGPVGVGALIIRRELKPKPLTFGGGQERDVRSGTIATALIAGFAAAVNSINKRPNIEPLRQKLIDGIRTTIPQAIINGSDEHHLPHILNVEFPGAESDAMLMVLDSHGVEVSTGSACTAGVPQPSHVLLAMGRSETAAKNVLRFSFGATSKPEDVDAVLSILADAYDRALAARRGGRK